MAANVTITVDARTEEAAAKMQRFFADFVSGVGNVSKAGDFFDELKARIAGALTIGAVVEFTREMINVAESIQRLNVETGFSIRLLSGLREEADKTRGGFENIEAALGMFSRRLGEAVRVGGASAKVFRDMIGVGALGSFASGATKIDDVLKEVIERFKAMPEGPQKTALAMDLFGRSGREVLPVLDKIKEGLGAGAVTPQLAAEATAFNVAMRELRDTVENLGLKMASNLLPKLIEFSEWVKQQAGPLADLSNNFKLLGASLAMKLSEGLINSLTGFTAFLAEVMIGFAGKISAAIDEALVGSINAVIGKINASEAFGRIFGKSIQPVSLSDVDGQMQKQIATVKEWDKTLQGLTSSFFGVGQASARFLSRGTKAGTGGASGAGGASGFIGPQQVPASQTAIALMQEIDKAFAEATQGKLAQLEQERLAQLKKATEEMLSQGEIDKINATFAAKKLEITKQQAQAELEISLAKVQGQRHLIEQDPDATELQKKAKLLALLAEENRLLAQNIAIKEQQVRDDKLTPEARLTAEKQLQDLQQRQAENQLTMTKTGRTGTFGGEFKNQFIEIQKEWGSFAGQMATAFRSVFENAIKSVSDGITGLIMYTKSWGQALSEIGTSILTSIVSAIVQMGVRWIATQILMHTVGLALQSSAVAATAPMAALASGIWAAPATLAAIATFGASAALAPAEILAAQGAVLASSVAQFDEGGFTGMGSTGDVAGLVHKREFVLNAPTTARLGVPALESLNAGGGLPGQGNGAGGEMHVHIWGDQEGAMLNFLQNNPKVPHVVVNHVKQQIAKITPG